MSVKTISLLKLSDDKLLFERTCYNRITETYRLFQNKASKMLDKIDAEFVAQRMAIQIHLSRINDTT
jgi:hypothetical protein